MAFRVKDHYYKLAKKEKFLARSIFKLEEIDKKFKILKRGQNVIDLGYFPGSWIQYTSPIVGLSGSVLGIDIQPVNRELLSLDNVELFQRDIFEISNIDELNVQDKFDLLLSDMAPNTSGIKCVDQDRSLNLVEKVFTLLPILLKDRGDVVIKFFDSSNIQEFIKKQKKLFTNFNLLRPKSTRSTSKEVFMIGKGFHQRLD